MKWYVYYVGDDDEPFIIKDFDSREEAKEFLKDYRLFRDKWFDVDDPLFYVFHIGNDFDGVF